MLDVSGRKVLGSIAKQTKSIAPHMNSDAHKLVQQIKSELAPNEKFLGMGNYGVVLGVSQPDGSQSAVKILRAVPRSYIDNEIEGLAVAGPLGIGPKIKDALVQPLVGMPSKASGVIEMEHLDPERFIPYGNLFTEHNETNFSPEQRNAVSDISQQLAELTLRNTLLEDRHSNNVLIDKETGMPIQIDFGSARKISDPMSIQASLGIVAEEMRKRGQLDEAAILAGLVQEQTMNGNYDEAKFHIKEGLDILGRMPASETPATPSILNHGYF